MVFHAPLYLSMFSFHRAHVFYLWSAHRQTINPSRLSKFNTVPEDNVNFFLYSLQ